MSHTVTMVTGWRHILHTVTMVTGWRHILHTVTMVTGWRHITHRVTMVTGWRHVLHTVTVVTGWRHILHTVTMVTGWRHVTHSYHSDRMTSCHTNTVTMVTGWRHVTQTQLPWWQDDVMSQPLLQEVRRDTSHFISNLLTHYQTCIILYLSYCPFKVITIYLARRRID